MRVAIDPGHNSSGFDTGAQGNGLLEQDITLDIGLRLKPLLEANGIQVVMTRTGGQVAGVINSVTDSLQARCDIANNAVVDLFVAIHINAGGGTGSEVWVVSTGGRAEKAANAVLARLIASCGWANRGVKVTNDYVLKYTDAPAILTENGFIDSVSDSAKLKDSAFIQAIAVAHAKGICDYFGITYAEQPPQPTPTPSVTILDAPTHILAPTQSLNFTHPNNAKVVKDDLFIRDANGSIIPGRYVSNGDNITVLDVGYTRQLVLVEYPTPLGVSKGYVANVVSCIQYYNQGQWQNGSTPETVYDENGGALGSLDPRETATPLYRKNGKLHVVYATSKGVNTKSGYVAWDGGFNKF
jgi:hypothetical protein